MNDINFLKSLDKQKTFLDHKHAVLSAPVRHLFMIGVVWYLNRKKSNLSVLEIGSWFGASTLSWAQGILRYADSESSITCVDAWKPFFDMDIHSDKDYAKEMEDLLKSDFAYNVFLHNMGTLQNKLLTKHFRGQSETILPNLKEKTYDIVFIDADHTYEPVKNDISKSLRLVRDGGIICGDDLNLQLHEIDLENAINNKNRDFVNDPLTGKNFHPGVTIAVAEHFGEVSSWAGFWGMQKKKNDWVKFSLKDMEVVYPDHFTELHAKKARDHFNDIKDSLY